MGKTIETNSYGDDLKSKFLALQEALTAKFGKPDDTSDFLQAGSIWNERRDWMMGLRKKERILASFWKFDNGASLMLEANALSGEKGYVTVSFEFPNFDTWKQEHDQKKNAAF